MSSPAITALGAVESYLSQTIMQAIRIMDMKAWAQERFEGIVGQGIHKDSATPPLSTRAKIASRRRSNCRTRSAGSRHGAPLRASHRTASTNRRSSWPVTPRSAALPGIESWIQSHYASDRTVRIKTASFQKTVLNHADAYLGIPLIVHRT